MSSHQLLRLPWPQWLRTYTHIIMCNLTLTRPDKSSVFYKIIQTKVPKIHLLTHSTLTIHVLFVFMWVGRNWLVACRKNKRGLIAMAKSETIDYRFYFWIFLAWKEEKLSESFGSHLIEPSVTLTCRFSRSLSVSNMFCCFKFSLVSLTFQCLAFLKLLPASSFS